MCGGTSVAGPCVLFLLLLADFLEVLPFAVVECDIVSRWHVEALDSFRAAGRYCQSTLQLQRRRHTDHVIRRRRILVCLDLPVREWRCTPSAVYCEVDNNIIIEQERKRPSIVACSVLFLFDRNRTYGIHSAVIFCQASSSLTSTKYSHAYDSNL